MKKLKPIAYELINLKREIMNTSYSKTVKQALEVSVDQMLEKGFINLDTQLYIKDNNFSLDNFKKYLHEDESFKKSKDELQVEYEEFLKEIEKEIIELGLDKDEFYCKVDLENEKIKICKIFCLKPEFLKDFFYIEADYADEYLEKLMSRKGFVERFAVLRLPRIFFNFIDSYDESNNFKLEKTYPYFDSNSNCYSIDLVFDIKIENIEKYNSRKTILKEVLPVIHNAQAYFEEKMSI